MRKVSNAAGIDVYVDICVQHTTIIDTCIWAVDVSIQHKNYYICLYLYCDSVTTIPDPGQSRQVLVRALLKWLLAKSLAI